SPSSTASGPSGRRAVACFSRRGVDLLEHGHGVAQEPQVAIRVRDLSAAFLASSALSLSSIRCSSAFLECGRRPLNCTSRERAEPSPVRLPSGGTLAIERRALLPANRRLPQ